MPAVFVSGCSPRCVQEPPEWLAVGEITVLVAPCLPADGELRPRCYHKSQRTRRHSSPRGRLCRFPAALGAGPAMLAGEMVHRVRAELPAVGGLGEREQRDRDGGGERGS